MKNRDKFGYVHEPPTVRNKMKCTLPLHACVSYLENVKVYESGIGAECQQDVDDFQEFSDFIDRAIVFKTKNSEIFDKLK